MRTLLVPVLLALLGSGLGAVAVRAEPPPGCEVPSAPQTAMQAGALGRASHVLLGEVESVRNVRGMVLARVTPVRAIKGDVPKGVPLTVLIRGPRPTGDRDQPSAPYLTGDSRGRYVFFLERQRDGVAFSLLTMFSATGDLGVQKLAALTEHARLAVIRDPVRRGRETVSWLLDSQKTNGTWTRVHTARELTRLAGLRPDLFGDEARASIRKLLRRGALPAQRRWLVRTLEALGDTTPVPPAPPAETVGLDALLGGVEAPRARMDALRGFLHRGGSWREVLARLPKEAPAVRLFVLTTLADGGYVSAVEGIRGLYANEDDAKVLGAIVRAVGLLGSASDVPWLVDRVGNVRTRREALFALARIRTPEALEGLKKAGEAAAADGGASGDILPLVEYLQSPVFVEVETAAGRQVGSDRRR